jgi:hypothetical protein
MSLLETVFSILWFLDEDVDLSNRDLVVREGNILCLKWRGISISGDCGAYGILILNI